MNDSNNTASRNEDLQVIARLRSALDEVVEGGGDGDGTGGGGNHGLAFAGPPSLPTHRPLRVLAVATAIVVLGVSTGWIIVVRGDRTKQSSPLDTAQHETTQQSGPDANVKTTASVSAPTTSLTPKTISGADWYAIFAAGLSPEPITVVALPRSYPCCPSTVMAWAAKSGYQDGILLLLAQPTQSGADVVKIMSFGLSNARTAELTSEIVPGSGLPYELPDPAMGLIGVGLDGAGAMVSQRYVGGADSVTMSVGDYRGQLMPIVLGAGLHPVDVAQQRGYRYADEHGVHIVWRTQTGRWATLDITQGLIDREAEIVAAVSAAP